MSLSEGQISEIEESARKEATGQIEKRGGSVDPAEVGSLAKEIANGLVQAAEKAEKAKADEAARQAANAARSMASQDGSGDPQQPTDAPDQTHVTAIAVTSTVFTATDVIMQGMRIRAAEFSRVGTDVRKKMNKVFDDVPTQAKATKFALAGGATLAHGDPKKFEEGTKVMAAATENLDVPTKKLYAAQLNGHQYNEAALTIYDHSLPMQDYFAHQLASTNRSIQLMDAPNSANADATRDKLREMFTKDTVAHNTELDSLNKALGVTDSNQNGMRNGRSHQKINIPMTNVGHAASGNLIRSTGTLGSAPGG